VAALELLKTTRASLRGPAHLRESESRSYERDGIAANTHGSCSTRTGKSYLRKKKTGDALSSRGLVNGMYDSPHHDEKPSYRDDDRRTHDQHQRNAHAQGGSRRESGSLKKTLVLVCGPKACLCRRLSYSTKMPCQRKGNRGKVTYEETESRQDARGQREDRKTPKKKSWSHCHGQSTTMSLSARESAPSASRRRSFLVRRPESKLPRRPP